MHLRAAQGSSPFLMTRVAPLVFRNVFQLLVSLCMTCFYRCSKDHKYMFYTFVSATNEVIIKKWSPAVLEQEISNAAAGIWKKLHVPHHSLDSSTKVVRLLKDGRSSEPELLLYYSMIRCCSALRQFELFIAYVGLQSVLPFEICAPAFYSNLCVPLAGHSFPKSKWSF